MICSILFFLEVLGIASRVLHMLGKYTQPLSHISSPYPFCFFFSLHLKKNIYFLCYSVCINLRCQSLPSTLFVWGRTSVCCCTAYSKLGGLQTLEDSLVFIFHSSLTNSLITDPNHWIWLLPRFWESKLAIRLTRQALYPLSHLLPLSLHFSWVFWFSTSLVRGYKLTR